MKSVFSFIFFTILTVSSHPDVIKATIKSEERKNSTTPTIDKFKLQDKIVNPHDFSYILNPGHRICKTTDQSSEIFLLIYVHTSPSNFKRRLSLRETWARRSMFRDIRVVFMMGDVVNKKTKELVNMESNIYGDIVQENFMDAYKNLTYKGIMAMKWITEFCPKAKFILKVDDDIIANIFILMRHLHHLDTHKVLKNKTVMCLVWIRMVVMREKNSKWFLTKEEFEDDYFGKYCSGSAYMFTNDLPNQMYNASKYLKFFWIDDYYITGMLAKILRTKQIFFNSVYIINSNLVKNRFLDKKASERSVFGHVPNKLNQIYEIWDFILKKIINQYPNLNRGRVDLISKKDFIILRNFKIPVSFWNKYYNLRIVSVNTDSSEY